MKCTIHNTAATLKIAPLWSCQLQLVVALPCNCTLHHGRSPLCVDCYYKAQESDNNTALKSVTSKLTILSGLHCLYTLHPIRPKLNNRIHHFRCAPGGPYNLSPFTNDHTTAARTHLPSMKPLNNPMVQIVQAILLCINIRAFPLDNRECM